MPAPHRLAQPAVVDCDVLIVGSGAGGASVAEVLTKAGKDVLMVEEGPYLGEQDGQAPLPQAFRRSWRAGGLCVALGRPPIAYAEGRCVGGGTEINNAIVQRAPGDLLDSWAKAYALDEFGATAIAPFYDRVDAVVSATLPEVSDAPSERLRRGAEALGWRVDRLPQAVKVVARDGPAPGNRPRSIKQSMTATLLPQAIERGMRLIAECRVTRLQISRRVVRRAYAWATDFAGRRHKVEIRPRDVFLCGGAIHTPALLRRSGLTRNVGNSLRCHPMLKMVAVFDEDVNPTDLSVPLYAVTEFMPTRRIGGSTFSLGLLAVALAEDWPGRAPVMDEWRRTAIYYIQITSTGKGTVRAPPSFLGEPLVRYAMTPEDWLHLGQGSADLARLLFAAGARTVLPGIVNHPAWRSHTDCRFLLEDAAWRKKASLSTVHLVGSCPPGEALEITATDSFGRVRGMQNLFVADASHIPEAPGVNPQATVMALAFRAGEMFVSRCEAAARHSAFLEDAAS